MARGKASTGHRHRRAWVVAAAISTAAVGTMLPATSGAASGTYGDFTVAAHHEGALAQPTETGRTLTELRAHDGAIWAGYGDYQDNTGPITIASYEPSSGTGFVGAFTSDTEAVYNLREVNGRLVAPATDPRAATDYAIDGPWRDQRPLGATHVYDTATLDGTDLWMVGSENIDAVAWRSLDGGATWAEALRVPAQRKTTFARFYFAAVLDGSVIVQAVDASGGPHPSALGFDGTTWTERPSVLGRTDRGWQPQAFGTGFVFHSSGHAWLGEVRFHDGTTTTTVQPDAYDVEVVGDHVWVLTGTGAVLRSADLQRWQHVGQAPTTARSLAVSGSSVYVGTTAAELLQMPVPDLLGDPVVVEPVDDTTPSTGTARQPNGKATRCPKGWQNRNLC